MILTSSQSLSIKNMYNSAVENWFQALKKVWMNKETDNIGDLLSSTFQYYEDPFSPPLTSLDEVKNAWGEVSDQNILKLEIQTLATEGNKGSASYEFSYTDPQGITHNSKGAYYVKLDDQGKAVEFRQWWMNR